MGVFMCKCMKTWINKSHYIYFWILFIYDFKLRDNLFFVVYQRLANFREKQIKAITFSNKIIFIE